MKEYWCGKTAFSFGFTVKNKEQEMSDGFKITGNWNFDGKKSINPKELDAAKLEKMAKASKLQGKVDFSDGINNKEAEYIMMEFEKDGLVDFDDFDINDDDVKTFLSNKGVKDLGKAQIASMKSAINAIADKFGEGFKTANTAEDYTAIQDIYLTGGNPNASISISPSKIDPKNPNGATQTITAPGVNKTNNPQQGSTLSELINNAYALNDIAKNNGLKDTEGVLHNLVDEYLQSNPELAARISELNGGKNIKDLSYDQILNTNLFKEGEQTAFKVIAPDFNLPTPKGAANVPENMQVAQKQYSTQNSKVDILNDGQELGENQYANVSDAIAAQYGLDKNDKNYENALKTIAFQIANDPKNAKAIETFINSLPKDEAVKYLNDNSRVEALLAANNIEGLHLPDNVLVNSIAAKDGKEYTYTTGSAVYQLSPLSPVDGQATGVVELAATYDGKETAGSVANLEDILKYSQDPRTGVALNVLNDKGEVVSNIKDEAAQGMATAYMMNSIKDNPAIFAASQEINGTLQMFGAYEIKDEAVLAKMQEGLDAAKKEGLSNEDAAAKVRADLINQFGDVDGDGKGKLEDFLEKYGSVNLDTAKSINFYDDKGNIRFKNADGTPVKYNVTETYVRFGAAKAVNSDNSTSNDKTPNDPFKPTPSTTPSTKPSDTPSTTPSTKPSTTPSTKPSTTPSTAPSTTPSTKPSTTPSIKPSDTPSITPSTKPSGTPSTTPSVKPSSTPSTKPSTTPSSAPSSTPSFNPEPPVTEPEDPTPSTEPIPSSEPPAPSSEPEPIPSDCPPPPPPSNGTSSTETDTVVTTPPAANEEPPAQAENFTPAPPPPPSAPSGGSVNNITGGSSSGGDNKPVENIVQDQTSTTIKDSDDVEKRKDD